MHNESSWTRRYDLDWLRNIGIFMLFPFHSARVFDHWDPFYVKSDGLSWGLSWFIVLTNLWFMPLLFWLAGSASWYALRKRSNQQYIKDRFYRLFIPLLFGVFFIVPPQGYYAMMQHKEESAGSYFLFLKSFFTDFSDLSGYFGTFTPAHLWFILYLFVLSLIALPVFSFVKNEKRMQVIQKINITLCRPLPFLLFFIVLVIAQTLPAPGGQNPFYFLVIFIMGFVTCSYQGYQEMFNRIRRKGLLMLMISVPALLFLVSNNLEGPHNPTLSILIMFLRTFNVWLSLLVILGYGHKFLNFKHKWLPYFNEAAFPVYIIHQTVLVVIGYYLLKLNFNIFVTYILIMVLTLTISILLYEWVIKKTAATRWLFGVKINKVKPELQKAEMSTSV